VSTVGTHCILELHGCCPELLNDPDALVGAMRRAAEAAGATWLNHVAHRFEPQGVTALGLLAESHISVHTWPELRYAAADVFTCGSHTDPHLACSILAESLSAGTSQIRSVPRAMGLSPEDLQAQRSPTPTAGLLTTA